MEEGTLIQQRLVTAGPNSAGKRIYKRVLSSALRPIVRRFDARGKTRAGFRGGKIAARIGVSQSTIFGVGLPVNDIRPSNHWCSSDHFWMPRRSSTLATESDRYGVWR